MEVSIIQAGDQLEIQISGELAIETVDRLQSVAESVPSGTARVVLNLADLSFVDSTGVNALLQSVLTFQNQGLHVSVENLREDLKEMLDVLGFFEVLSADLPD